MALNPTTDALIATECWEEIDSSLSGNNKDPSQDVKKYFRETFEAVKNNDYSSLKELSITGLLEDFQNGVGSEKFFLKNEIISSDVISTDGRNVAPFFLPQQMKEQYDMFCRSVTQTPKGQSATITLLYQTSLTGKTRYFYDYAKQHYAILLRKKGDLKIPVELILEKHQDSINFFKANLKELGKFCKMNQLVMEVWIVSHLEFWSECLQREIPPENFLRLSSNGGVGRKCIDLMFFNNLNLLLEEKWREKYSLILEYAKSHKPPVFFWDDWIPSSEVRNRQFVGYFKHRGENDLVQIGQRQLAELSGIQTERFTDLFYSMMSVVADLAFVDIRQMHSTTRTKSLSLIRKERENGEARWPVDDNFVPYQIASYNSLYQLLGTFKIWNSSEGEKLREDIINYFKGNRIGLMVEYFLVPLLSDAVETKETNEAEMRKKVRDCLGKVQQQLGDFAIGQYRLFRENIQKDDPDEVDKTLQYFFAIHNGHFKITTTEMFSDPVDYSFALLKQANPGKGFTHQTIAEPIFRDQIQSYVERMKENENDIILDKIISIHKHDRQLGTMAEELVARLFQIANGKSLSEIFDVEGFETVKINCGTKCGTFDELGFTFGLEGLVSKETSFQYFPDERGRIDLIVDLTDSHKLIVSIKDEAKSGSIPWEKFCAEALDQLNPSTFYAGQKEYSSWWKSHPDAFKKTIRCIVSITGFSSNVVRAVRSFNKISPKSAILLVSPFDTPKFFLPNNLKETLCINEPKKSPSDIGVNEYFRLEFKNSIPDILSPKPSAKRQRVLPDLWVQTRKETQ